MWMDDEMGGRAKEIICELNNRNTVLDEQIMKLEEKLMRKKKKTKLLKKKKEAQFNIFCIVIICFFGLILMMCISRELKTNGLHV